MKVNYKIIREAERIGILINDPNNKVAMKALYVDFLKPYYKFKRDRGLKNQILMRALGIKKGVESVVDATAGFCNDSLMMLAAGFDVVSVERSDVVYSLLEYAYSQFVSKMKTKEFDINFKIIHAESMDYLNSLTKTPPHAIYLDPMFPEKKKSLSPKGMQVLQNILPPIDMDRSRDLCEKALKIASKRLVVKRPLKAEALISHPSHKFLGKSIRYDMYLV